MKLRRFVRLRAPPDVRAATVRLLTYNILSEGLALSAKHSYCPEALRQWAGSSGGGRSARLISEIEGYAAEVVCVQECTAGTAFPALCDGLGAARRRTTAEEAVGGDGLVGFHHADFLPAGQRAAAAASTTGGLATFVRADVWRPLAVRAVQLGCVASAVAEGGAAASGRLERQLERKLRGRDEAVLMLLLEHTASGARLAVGNTHLHWDPRWPHLKAVQAERAARALRSFAAEGGGAAAGAAGAGGVLCLVGDFNSVPHLQPAFLPEEQRAALPEPLPPAWRGSGAYTLLTGGALPSEHPEHPDAFGRAPAADEADEAHEAERPAKKGKPALVGALRTGLELRDAYAGGLAEGPLPLTTNAEDFRGCLDYIFVGRAAAEGDADAAANADAAQVEVLQLLGLPYGAEGSHDGWETFGPIPDQDWPSDHLAVGAQLALPVAPTGAGSRAPP